MLADSTFGFIVADHLEQDLIRFTALDCGLQPLALSLDAPPPPLPPLIVIDETTSLPDLLHSYLLADQEMPLIVRIGDPLPPGHGTAAAPESLIWNLPRPLHLEAVDALLRQAISALGLIAARHRSLVDELSRLRGIFGSVSNGITIADASVPGLPLTYVNAAFERMTGYSAAEACGRNCRYLQGPETDQPGSLVVRHAIRQGREARVVLRNYRKDGTLFWNELFMSPIFDPNGDLTHFVGIQKDVTVEIESAERLHHFATHDALTGVANRSLMMSQLKQSLARAERSGRPVAVLFFDLNHFKQVNDVFGHDAGDRLLQTVAERLRSLVRAGETVARLGGDEFIVVLEDLSSDRQPAEVMHRLLARICEPLEIFGTPVHPSASVGMALFPADGKTAELLLKAADLKMYLAKHDTRSSQQAADEIDGLPNPISRRLA